MKESVCRKVARATQVFCKDGQVSYGSETSGASGTSTAAAIGPQHNGGALGAFGKTTEIGRMLEYCCKKKMMWNYKFDLNNDAFAMAFDVEPRTNRVLWLGPLLKSDGRISRSAQPKEAKKPSFEVIDLVEGKILSFPERPKHWVHPFGHELRKAETGNHAVASLTFENGKKDLKYGIVVKGLDKQGFYLFRTLGPGVPNNKEEVQQQDFRVRQAKLALVDVDARESKELPSKPSRPKFTTQRLEKAHIDAISACQDDSNILNYIANVKDVLGEETDQHLSFQEKCYFGRFETSGEFAQAVEELKTKRKASDLALSTLHLKDERNHPRGQSAFCAHRVCSLVEQAKVSHARQDAFEYIASFVDGNRWALAGSRALMRTVLEEDEQKARDAVMHLLSIWKERVHETNDLQQIADMHAHEIALHKLATRISSHGQGCHGPSVTQDMVDRGATSMEGGYGYFEGSKRQLLRKCSGSKVGSKAAFLLKHPYNKDAWRILRDRLARSTSGDVKKKKACEDEITQLIAGQENHRCAGVFRDVLQNVLGAPDNGTSGVRELGQELSLLVKSLRNGGKQTEADRVATLPDVSDCMYRMNMGGLDKVPPIRRSSSPFPQHVSQQHRPKQQVLSSLHPLPVLFPSPSPFPATGIFTGPGGADPGDESSEDSSESSDE